MTDPTDIVNRLEACADSSARFGFAWEQELRTAAAEIVRLRAAMTPKSLHDARGEIIKLREALTEISCARLGRKGHIGAFIRLRHIARKALADD